MPDDFNTGYGLGGPGLLGANNVYDPSVGLMMATQPEQFAKIAAAQGMKPPPVGNIADTYAPDLGQSLDAYTAPTAAAPAAGPPGLAGLAGALKGVSAPQQPKPQTVYSPRAPAPHGQIQQGELLKMLLGLNAGANVDRAANLGQLLGGR